jgi:dolichyl-phosphate-mannose--protein O-mannosyl transferase
MVCEPSSVSSSSDHFKNHPFPLLGEIKDLITCGSAIKLKLVEGKSSPYVLHSAAFNWGTGSGQQIVSLVRKSEASERTSLWQIREGHEAKYCKNGQPVRCGDTIRLMHVHTKKYLHTHNVPSILSKDSREVSAFANEKIESDKGGDTGDDWTIVCDGKFWMKGVDVKVRHVLTGSYLGR